PRPPSVCIPRNPSPFFFLSPSQQQQKARSHRPVPSTVVADKLVSLACVQPRCHRSSSLGSYLLASLVEPSLSLSSPLSMSPLSSRSLCVAVELSISLCCRRANDPSPRFRFRENAKMDQVKTSIENGVLTVTVPKAEVKKPNVKPIQIIGKPTLPTNFEEVTWAKLKYAICSIFLKQPDSYDLEKLYQ
ncbi:hypothetical protein S245_066900, partial [Arachis hypogaea]